jgi:hypothetical protein
MSKYIGFDSGTMNLVSAAPTADNKIELKNLRNMFLKVTPDDVSSTEMSQSNLNYVEEKDDNGVVQNIYIIGEDTFRFANIFGANVNRPMKNGVISTDEIDSQDILTLMVEKLIGKSNGAICVYSVPAQAVDEEIPPVSYHEMVWNNIFETLGYKAIALNEAQSIIFSECKSSNFSGIAISWGCGLTNVASCYKGIPTIKFSVNRGGDWIDKETAKSLGIPVVTRITKFKESELDLTSNQAFMKDKKKLSMNMALTHYYKQIIDHVLNNFIEQFNNSSNGLEIDEEIPIVISGGTSLPKGFLNLFIERFNEQYKEKFPYQVSEIRMVEDPLNSVAKGCLIYNLWKNNKEAGKK